jgi:hypothetical protein
MPYIQQDARALVYRKRITDLTRGELNYVITAHVDGWLGANISYDRINDAIGIIDELLDGNEPELSAPLSDEDVLRSVLDVIIREWSSTHTKRALRGVIRCAQAELYRRVAVPYEDAKIVENGDVYRNRTGSDWPPESHLIEQGL